jgi:hypothetical protein
MKGNLKDLGILEGVRKRGCKGGICRPKLTGYAQYVNNQGFRIQTLASCHRKPRQNRGVTHANLVNLLTGEGSAVQNTASVGLINARSVSNKAESIWSHIVDNDLDIVGITETWLASGDTEDTKLDEITPDGYSNCHIPRPNRRGGGVAIVHRSTLTRKLHTVHPAKSFESIEVNLTCASSCVKLIVVYRPPPSKQNGLTKQCFFSEFSDFLQNLITAPGMLLILGDFNFHFEKDPDPDAAIFRGLLDSVGLEQHVTGATHVSGHTLDLVISRSSDNLVSSSSVSTLISDHHAVHCTLQLEKPPLPRKTVTFRKYKSIDMDLLRKDLKQSLLLQEPATHLNELLTQYDTVLRELLEKHAPLKTRVMTERPLTCWYTPEIDGAKKLRRKLERRWRCSGLTVHREAYQAQRDVVNKLLKNGKTAFYKKQVEDCGGDQKALFRVVQKLLKPHHTQHLPSYSSLEEITERFSTFFTSKIENIRDKLDTAATPSCHVLPSPASCHVAPELTHLLPLTTEEITKIILKSPTKTCSLDPWPTWLLKDFIDILIFPITKIVNLSLTSGHVPEDMKQALVTPLLKKKSLDPEVMKHYRPVSNLSFISKITEKAVSKHVDYHMDTHRLHAKMQSAYRPLHSTETALLRVYNDLLNEVDRQRGIILVLLDLSAAFDTIDHKILLSRLHTQIGLSGTALSWFESYLSDRVQSVFINGKKSQPSSLKYGVPQGSVHGPKDFTQYTGPVINIALEHGVNVHLYADDTQLYFSFDPKDANSLNEAITVMEQCIARLKGWMKENKLQLNDEKTEVLFISSTHNSKKFTCLPLKIGDCSIQPSNTARNLGVIFDSQLKMNPHVSSLVRSANFHLRGIGRIRKYLDLKSAEKVIHAFVSSRLDTCNSLLYGLPGTVLNRLQKVQNTAARVLTRSKLSDHITPVLHSLHWLPVKQRVEYKLLVLTYRSLNGLAPTYLTELLHSYQPSHNLRSQDRLLLTAPKSHLKTYGDRSFASAAPSLWNPLPYDLKSADSLEAFKCGLKTYLFKSAYANIK